MALGVVTVLAVVTLQPQMQQVITGVTEVVTRVFRSFWDWLRGLFTTQTVTRPVTTTVKVYKIEVNGQTYTLKKVESLTDERLKTSNVYYIALFNGDMKNNSDRNIYLTYQTIPKNFAIQILISNILIPIEEGSSKLYRMHTYTALEELAYGIAVEAAELVGFPTEVYQDNCHSIKNDVQLKGYFLIIFILVWIRIRLKHIVFMGYQP